MEQPIHAVGDWIFGERTVSRWWWLLLPVALVWWLLIVAYDSAKYRLGFGDGTWRAEMREAERLKKRKGSR